MSERPEDRPDRPDAVRQQEEDKKETEILKKKKQDPDEPDTQE